MDNGAYGGAPYRLPEKFGLADTIGRKPRCEVGVFIFGVRRMIALMRATISLGSKGLTT